MSLSSFVADYTIWIGIALVGGFVLWKFILEPIANEGRPIEPDEEDIKTFGEKMQDSLQPGTDI